MCFDSSFGHDCAEQNGYKRELIWMTLAVRELCGHKLYGKVAGIEDTFESKGDVEFES